MTNAIVDSGIVERQASFHKRMDFKREIEKIWIGKEKAEKEDLNLCSMGLLVDFIRVEGRSDRVECLLLFNPAYP